MLQYTVPTYKLEHYGAFTLDEVYVVRYFDHKGLYGSNRFVQIELFTHGQTWSYIVLFVAATSKLNINQAQSTQKLYVQPT